MSFSEAVQKPFIASVLNPEELAEDNEVVVKFYCLVIIYILTNTFFCTTLCLSCILGFSPE